MPILILTNVKYLKIVVLSFEKDLNGHSSSDSHQTIQNSSHSSKVYHSCPHRLMLFEKPWALFKVVEDETNLR